VAPVPCWTRTSALCGKNCKWGFELCTHTNPQGKSHLLAGQVFMICETWQTQGVSWCPPRRQDADHGRRERRWAGMKGRVREGGW